MSAVPSGGLAVMQNRRDPTDSLDFFPTPPWATRALCEIVLPQLGFAPHPVRSAWEPACGAGHMAEVLREYFGVVSATDVHEYGYHEGCIDFLSGEAGDRDFDWIITNPPFALAGEFAKRALAESRVGVAFLVRSAWLEGGGRFRTIFEPHPPMAVAQFCERVPMVKGRWDPDASTATSYAWVVWAHLIAPQPTRFLWIPPGQRKTLARADDISRFARPAHDQAEGENNG